MSTVAVRISELASKGVEVLPRPSGRVIHLPRQTCIEAPASLKWTQYELSLSLGAFSYQVSGYCAAAEIGRYCSFGENVQIGRQNHPLTWASTSPAFYLKDRLFQVGDGFAGAEAYQSYAFRNTQPPTKIRKTVIGHDVWIGHGAMIAAGVKIGNGAIVAAGASVAKDVPPYTLVAGNPAVPKKTRVSTDQIAALQQSRWWQFAPWQLSHLDMADVPGFLRGVQDLGDAAPFVPSRIDLSQDMS
ncbi:CatB-related O-acetyltransferase [Roseovarius phycicola]|uniref:CatB-related O-acetyltransferase n=1 Tax=Roseovarius phycicola TaxID=3080976 RepID=A0ABZ2HIF3_9RHOB